VQGEEQEVVEKEVLEVVFIIFFGNPRVSGRNEGR
jgi:hypothetical protein